MGDAYGQPIPAPIHKLRSHVTRAFVNGMSALISEGRFADVGVPHMRLEGTTGLTEVALKF